MIKKVKQKGAELYKCEACGFHYLKRELAQECEEWCRKYKSCNIEITRQAVENK